MGCNAWNHRANCDCGWGGTWYGSVVRGSTDGAQNWHLRISYTNPNAYCPVCNQRVFFYRSPFGGSVFFDELGPPWPKHPCTDHSLAGVPRRAAKPATAPRLGSRPGYRGLKPEWEPLICSSIGRHPRCGEVTVLEIQDGPRGVTRLYSLCNREKLDYRTPFLYREDGVGKYQISTLSVRDRFPSDLRLTAFSSTSDLPEPYRSQVKIVFVKKRTGKAIAEPPVQKKATLTVPKKVLVARPWPAIAQTATVGASDTPRKAEVQSGPTHFSSNALTSLQVAFQEAELNRAAKPKRGEKISLRKRPKT